ncbi:MAG: hypothetical protein RSB68_02620 [Raoultibacter sp.]
MEEENVAEEISPEQQAAARSQAEAVAEHDALVAVFDDVRACSADSTLVQPTRWAEIGLVPDHMTADDFEMFVYEYLEDFLAQEAEAAASAPAVEKPVFRSATRAVGVALPPQVVPTEAEAEAAGVAEGAADQAESCEVAADEAACWDADAPDEASLAVAPEALIDGPAAEQEEDVFAADVPVFSQSGKVMIVDGEPMFVADEEQEPEQNAPIRALGIAVLQGQHSYYLYSREYMTDNYAHWSYLAHEDNAVVSLVDCAREESRVYPRPMPAESLYNPPFNMDDAQIAAAWKIIEESGDFPDIETVSASNDEVYYFSTTYMSRAYAQSLAEWASVERQMNM